MQRLLIYLLLILCAVTTLLSQQERNVHTRIIIFNRIGQKETVKTDENVSIVLGASVKPEYSYLAYSAGKSANEYIIELKTNELLLRQIAQLRYSLDSAKMKQEETERILAKGIKTQEEELKPLKALQGDTTQRKVEKLLEDNKLSTTEYSIFNIPKYKEFIDAAQGIVKKNNTSIDENNQSILKNRTRIEKIREEIEQIKKTGKNTDMLEDYINENDSLLAFNTELLRQNNNLSQNKLLLEKELKVRELMYDSLVKLIIFLAVLSGLAVILAIVIFMFYKQKKKFSAELSSINNVLRNTNTQLSDTNVQLKIINYEKEKILRLIKDELLQASEYVVSLIPKPIREGQIKTDWIFIPSEDLGGDSFGYNWIDDDNFAIYLLDVSGHGVGPALHSVQVLNILQNRTLPLIDFMRPDEVMNALNQIFQMDQHNGIYFSLWYGVYNISSGKLRYSSAGHPPMLLINKDNIVMLPSQNTLIGVLDKCKFKFDEVIIKKGTNLYLFSDGVFEIKNQKREWLTFNDFKVKLINNLETDRKELSSLYDYAKELSGKNTLDDDFTILKVRFQ